MSEVLEEGKKQIVEMRMVRINLIKTECLSDQHLIAEYREILLLIGYTRKHPTVTSAQSSYDLFNPIRFFKNKLVYLERRFRDLKAEMVNRGFKPKKSLSLNKFPKSLLNDYNPTISEISLVKKRIIQRLKEKPEWHRYYGKHIGSKRLINLIKEAS